MARAPDGPEALGGVEPPAVAPGSATCAGRAERVDVASRPDGFSSASSIGPGAADAGRPRPVAGAGAGRSRCRPSIGASDFELDRV